MRDYEELVERLREAPSDWPDAELHYDAADAIEELKQNIEQYKLYLQDAINDLRSAHEKEQKWISVEERLPEEETDVLVCSANGEIQIASGSYSTEMKDYFIWYTTGWRFGKAIAWMPLPEPYKEENNG